jgi:hypothetical protein
MTGRSDLSVSGGEEKRTGSGFWLPGPRAISGSGPNRSPGSFSYFSFSFLLFFFCFLNSFIDFAF